MLAYYCWPIVYDHGSAVKQHWLKFSFLQGTPATQYPDTMLVQCWKSIMVSPPQMPVPLKHMYNANIPRAEITTFVPSCPPMWHTIIKPKLSFFKNCFENGMLTSCFWVTLQCWKNGLFCPDLPKYSCAHSQKRHKSFSPHVSIRKSHITVIPHITDSKNSVCLQFYPHNYNIPVFFLIHQKRKQPFEAVIWVGIL